MVLNNFQLQSPRLLLRLITINDLVNIHELHAIAAVDEYNTLGIPENIEATKAVITPWIEAHGVVPIQNYTLAIEQEGVFVGLFGLKVGTPKYRRAEIWYKLHPDFWSQGLATEAVITILNFAFEELKLHRVSAGCAVNNIGSIRVLEKVGMLREGRGRQILPLVSGWSDNYEYAILSADKRMGKLLKKNKSI